MNAEFVDEPLLRTLAATLIAEYEYVRLYQPAARVLMFLASDAPLDVELELARTGRPIVENAQHFSRFGINGVEDIAGGPGPGRAGHPVLRPPGRDQHRRQQPHGNPKPCPGGWTDQRGTDRAVRTVRSAHSNREAGSTRSWAARSITATSPTG